MLRISVVVIGLLAAICLSCCLSAPFQPPTGMVAETTAPLSTEGNWNVGLKSGEASSFSILGLYASGDCSISAAALNGGLKKIYHVDYKYRNIIGIWQKATVIAYGE